MGADAVSVRVTTHAMGSEFALLLVGTDGDALREAGNAALSAIEAAEAQLSHTIPGSELWDVNEQAARHPVRVTPSLWELLVEARQLTALTGGAFDITVGALLRCWGFYRGDGRLPAAAEIEHARARCGWQNVILNSAERTVHFATEGVALHLGAIGKGCALDRAAEVLRDHGVGAALLHGGGSSVLAIGSPPGETGWRIGICHPGGSGRRLGVAVLRDAALSTSEPAAQSFAHAGQRYGHILDPRSGWPAAGVWSATAIARGAAASDALSTAFAVAGRACAQACLDQQPAASPRVLGAVLLHGGGSTSDVLGAGVPGAPGWDWENGDEE